MGDEDKSIVKQAVEDIGGRKFIGSMVVLLLATLALWQKWIPADYWFQLTKWVTAVYVGGNLGSKILDIVNSK